MSSLPLVAARLDDLAVVDISGPDAAAFLQGQLTQDLSRLDAGHARLAGYCSPKGRLIASMIVWHAGPPGPDTFRALLKRDIAQDFIGRLSRFILRAKVTAGVSEAPVIGVTLDATAAAQKSLGPAGGENTASGLPPDGLARDAAPYDMIDGGAGTWIAAPCADARNRRWWLVAAGARPLELDAGWNFAADASAWRVQDIAAGLGWVQAGIQEMFIPQTLNMDIVDGVSFGKGCYPGQEIVARSHYRGTVKRRMMYGTADASPDGGAAAPDAAPGADIFDARDPDAPCGRVVNAAASGRTHLLFEAPLASLGKADFRLFRADGPAIAPVDLPYDIRPA